MEAEAVLVAPTATEPQGLLFDELAFFTGDGSPEAERYSRHTGTTTARRKELCESMLRHLAAGASQNQVAAIFRVSQNTVSALARQWASAGKLEAAKKKIVQELDQIMPEQLRQYSEGLAARMIPARELPIHFGIFADKREMLEQTMASAGADVPVAAELSIEALNELVAALPSDCASEGNPSKPQ